MHIPFAFSIIPQTWFYGVGLPEVTHEAHDTIEVVWRQNPQRLVKNFLGQEAVSAVSGLLEGDAK